MHVLLFDIDGTLIRAGKASLSAITESFREGFGIVDPNLNVVFQGNTDYAIGRNLLVANDLQPDSTNTAKLWHGYKECLDSHLETHRPEVFSGVIQLVDYVLDRTDSFFSAVMTGNMEETAWIKLRHTSLDKKFSTGVFGDNHPDRNSLASAGLELARTNCGKELPKEHVVVIGDTMNDITCARSIGAQTIIVGTGYGDKQELKDKNPDLYVEDFTDPQVFEFLSNLES